MPPSFLHGSMLAHTKGLFSTNNPENDMMNMDIIEGG